MLLLLLLSCMVHCQFSRVLSERACDRQMLLLLLLLQQSKLPCILHCWFGFEARWLPRGYHLSVAAAPAA
jgi:hypothetical protein